MSNISNSCRLLLLHQLLSLFPSLSFVFVWLMLVTAATIYRLGR
jgi:hypothetical protein